jgi:nitroreductase
MDNSIFGLTKSRHSWRMPFNPDKPVSKTDMERILDAGSWAPTAHNMQNFETIVVDDKQLLEKIGNIKTKTSVEFIRENQRQLSASAEELKQKKTGILGTMFPPEWRSPDADFEKLVRESPPSTLKSTLKNCPTLLIVLYDSTKRAPASEGDVLGFISLGCVMENMWLAAESLGIGLQIMSVFSGENVEPELRKILGFPGNLKIAYSARLGYPQTPSNEYLRVRRNVPDFTHYNGY